MALGFKIADGYVEVHANYDKKELHKAAGDAVHDFDEGWQRETDRDSRRQGHGVAGGLENQVRRDRNRFQRLGQRISEHMFGSGSATTGAAAFMRNFVEAITLGQADFGRVMTTGLATTMARVGTGLGVGFAVAFVGRATQAIVSLLPVALGAIILALPIIHLIRQGLKKVDGKWVINTANQMGRAIKRLKDSWKSFIDTISKPFKAPLIEILKAAGKTLDNLAKPMKDMVKAISPGAVAFMKGFFKGIEAFVKAVGPAMPGVNAGLKQWGKELPKIFKAIGDLFSKVLKDPNNVKSDIKATSDLIVGLLGLLGDVIVKITDLMVKYDQLGQKIDTDPRTGKKTPGNKDSFAAIGNMAMHNPIVTALDNWSDKVKAKIRAFGAWLLGGGLARPVQTAINKAIGFFKDMGVKIPAAVQGVQAKITAFAKGVADAVVRWFRTLPGKVSAIWNQVKSSFVSHMSQVATSAKNMAKRIVDGVINFFKTLPSKAKGAVGSLWSAMSGAFTKAASQAKAKATDLVNRVVSFLKGLPGKARSAVSSLWSSMSGAFSSAVSKAKAAATKLVSGFINTLKGIVAKARAQVNAAKNAIVSAFSGAGSWLVSAGRSIMTGLANGIRNGASAAISAAGSAARSALAAAKRALGIASPSKRFAEEVGKPAAQGIALGLQKHFRIEMDGLPELMPAMAGGGGGSSGGAKSYSSTFSPNVVVHISEGLNPMNAAARRALIKDIFLELEQYKKDYVR